MQKRGWKVLYMANGTRHSFRWPCGIYYPFGVWVTPRPNCGPLAVFATREDAQRFILDELDRDAVQFFEVVPCVWEPWNERLPRNDKGIPIAFWDGQGRQLINCLPRGTRLASAVMCLE
ncbi:MAG: hypothetical protein NZ739_11860 [Verrucomicrobiae bacterium]|nr:hypothetical protein [Verrucomicrobiae bacterium]